MCFPIKQAHKIRFGCGCKLACWQPRPFTDKFAVISSRTHSQHTQPDNTLPLNLGIGRTCKVAHNDTQSGAQFATKLVGSGALQLSAFSLADHASCLTACTAGHVSAKHSGGTQRHHTYAESQTALRAGSVNGGSLVPEQGKGMVSPARGWLRRQLIFSRLSTTPDLTYGIHPVSKGGARCGSCVSWPGVAVVLMSGQEEGGAAVERKGQGVQGLPAI